MHSFTNYDKNKWNLSVNYVRCETWMSLQDEHNKEVTLFARLLPFVCLYYVRYALMFKYEFPYLSLGVCIVYTSKIIHPCSYNG